MAGYMLILTAMLSLTMLACGWVFANQPPAKNPIMGYRTPRSMKNDDTWDYAHRYAGRVWLRTGVINLLVAGPLIWGLQHRPNYEQIVLWLFYLQLAGMIAVIPLTEVSLGKAFDREGKRR